MEINNQASGQANSIPGNEPEYLEIGLLEQPSGDHYQALNNEIGGPNNEYQGLNFSGQLEA